MTENKIKEYTFRITNASQGQLLVIVYELLLDTIGTLKQQIKDNDIDEFYKTMKKAQKILKQLTDNLDMQYEISLDIMALYLYTHKQLSDAAIKFKQEPLEKAEKILKTLLKGWEEVTNQENQTAVMKNSQQVYAGLTYGRGTLNEDILNDNNRGYKA